MVRVIKVVRAVRAVRLVGCREGIEGVEDGGGRVRGEFGRMMEILGRSVVTGVHGHFIILILGSDL